MNVRPVAGGVEIDVNDLRNTGRFEARLNIPEGDLVLVIDRFHEFSPGQNGGIVGFLHEHGTDSGCGDNNWPKTFVYNPATQQIDFYIRNPQTNPKNTPNGEVFLHFFGMEVTWK